MRKERKRLLGESVKRNLPELADLEDEELLGEVFNDLYPQGETPETPPAPTHLSRQLGGIEKLEDPDSGVIETFLRRKNLEGKTKRQEEANKYKNQVLDSQRIQADIDRLEADAQQGEATHNLFLLRVDQAGQISKEAKKNKLDDATYLALKQTEIANKLSLAQKIEMDKIELKRRWKEIKQDLRAGFTYQLQAYQHLQLLTEYIGGLYDQVRLAGNERTKALLEEHITFMEGEFRGKQRLLQITDGQEPEGDTPTDEPSDPR